MRVHLAHASLRRIEPFVTIDATQAWHVVIAIVIQIFSAFLVGVAICSILGLPQWLTALQGTHTLYEAW